MLTMRKNFWLDILLFSSGLVCIMTGLIVDFHFFTGGKAVKSFLLDIHKYAGYAMGLGLLLHLFWHRQWIAAAIHQARHKA